LGEKPHEDMAWETCFSKKGLEGKAEGLPWKLLCSVLRIMYFLHALSWIIWESVMAERQFDSHKTHLVEVVRGSPRIFEVAPRDIVEAWLRESGQRAGCI
jgi:hypothetical protein